MQIFRTWVYLRDWSKEEEKSNDIERKIYLHIFEQLLRLIYTQWMFSKSSRDFFRWEIRIKSMQDIFTNFFQSFRLYRGKRKKENAHNLREHVC